MDNGKSRGTTDENWSESESGSVSMGESNREEELEELRRAQLAAIKNEIELNRRTLEALREEAEDRVAAFCRLMQGEKEIRRGDGWWSELMERRPDITARVRRTCEMTPDPKKIVEAKTLWRELENRRRLLAMARAVLMRERADEETMEDVDAHRPLHLQNSRLDSMEHTSNEESDDDTLTNFPPDRVPGAPSGPERAFASRFGNRRGRGRSAGRSPVNIAPAQQNPRLGQLERDFQLAMAWQQAEIGPRRAPGTDRGQ